MIVSPFEIGVKQVTAENAERCNKSMIERSDEIVLGFASKGGILNKLIGEIKGKNVYRIVE